MFRNNVELNRYKNQKKIISFCTVLISRYYNTRIYNPRVVSDRPRSWNLHHNFCLACGDAIGPRSFSYFRASFLESVYPISRGSKIWASGVPRTLFAAPEGYMGKRRREGMRVGRVAVKGQ